MVGDPTEVAGHEKPPKQLGTLNKCQLLRSEQRARDVKEKACSVWDASAVSETWRSWKEGRVRGYSLTAPEKSPQPCG